MRRRGKVALEFLMAERTRSLDSCTAASGRPTIVIIGTERLHSIQLQVGWITRLTGPPCRKHRRIELVPSCFNYSTSVGRQFVEVLLVVIAGQMLVVG